MEPLASSADRRFTDSAHQFSTQVGRDTVVRGNLAGSDPVEIRGTLEGDCVTSAHCMIRDRARVVGNITAAGLIVAGEVEAGEITADKVEIRASARVRGTIRARVVAIAEGALYEGDVQMQGPGAASGPIIFKEQRQSTVESASASVESAPSPPAEPAAMPTTTAGN